ncbi:MAG: hypothetical protein JWO72_2613, partial [Caulobacteraceae bacterium]|nr:hypothetical protein [Caulobacteraceae bacterium]
MVILSAILGSVILAVASAAPASAA